MSFFAMVLLLRIAKQMRLLEHTAIVVVFAIGTLALLARYIGTFVAMRRRGSE